MCAWRLTGSRKTYYRSCTFCCKAATKKGLGPEIVQQKSLKYVKGVSFKDHLSLVQSVTNIPVVAPDRSTCRDQIAPILGKMGRPWGKSKGHKNPQRRLHSPLLDPMKPGKAIYHHKCLCKSSQEQLPDRGVACTCAKECSRTGENPEISRFLQPTFLDTKAQKC